MRSLHARWMMTGNGWLADAMVTIVGGRVFEVRGGVWPRPAQARPVDLLVPGMPDAHCHAFQHQIAGLAEGASGDGDSFWTWRERMYEAVDLLSPERLRVEATRAYRRLRANGYTSVAEFHYVHHAGGAHPMESALALAEAARSAGLRLLLLPVLYRRGGFGGEPLSERQGAFALDPDAYGALLAALAARADAAFTLGVAPHSLRAVGADDLWRLMEIRAQVVPGCPVHIHVSEQAAEVEAARAHLGTTPIDWLCVHAPVDSSWTMVHATHATGAELRELARRGATVCVCTTTEANLGDGAFDIDAWWALGGGLAVGSDSNVGVDPAEELRWLEYQARLRKQRRALLVDAVSPHPGSALWRRAVAGGRRAFGIVQRGIEVGAPAELLALTVDDPRTTPDEAMDDFVFARRATRMLVEDARR